MNRRSVIRCILGLAAAPKILAKMDFKPPFVAQSYGQQITRYLQSINNKSTIKYHFSFNERFKQTLLLGNSKENVYENFANQLQHKEGKILQS